MFRDPSSLETTSLLIRNKPNHLQTDPDVEENIYYHISPALKATDTQWQVCATIFSECFGVWGREAQGALAGRNVTMNADELKATCAPHGANNILITALTRDGEQVGHCCVSQWAHQGERVWWMTQMVVRPEYCDQRRATRMLHALTKQYDIGRNPYHKDFVGVLSAHPYTVCAALRVFGRGIEALPSKNDMERQRGPAIPLQAKQCAKLMQSSPVDYVRTAVLHPTSLTADTKFFVDHTATDEALRRISFGMNKQLREPWQWPFGELPPGHEYLCVLEYRFDPGYNKRPQLCEELEVPSMSAMDAQRSDLNDSPQAVDYARLNELLVRSTAPEDAGALSRRPGDQNAESSAPDDDGSVKRADSNIIFDACQTLNARFVLVPQIMDAKRIPFSIPPLYVKLLSDTDVRTSSLESMLERIKTWHDMKCWAGEWYEIRKGLETRLKVLQGVHFRALSAECEKLKEEAKRRERMKTRMKKVRMVQPMAVTNGVTSGRRTGGLSLMKVPKVAVRMARRKDSMNQIKSNACTKKMQMKQSMASLKDAMAQRNSDIFGFIDVACLSRAFSKLRMSVPKISRLKVKMPWRKKRRIEGRLTLSDS